MNEQELIQLAQRGDGGAIRTLYAQHASRVYSVVRRLAGEDDLADDWAQDAWVRAIRALPEFRGESRFGTWIHRIAVNTALAGLRAAERRNGREEEAGGRDSVVPAGEQTLLRVRIDAALDRLPAGMRRVLVLHDVEGYTHAEIATLLGVAPGTCKSQLFKARARMRELLGAAMETIEEEAWNT